MEEVVKKKPFNKRAFISTALFVSGVSLPFTGFMNHSLQFDYLTIERHFWMSAHDVAGILFVLFAILHISFNWRVLLNYAKKAKERFVSKETLTAIALVIIVVGLISSHVFHIDK
jgi:hypothetical protein